MSKILLCGHTGSHNRGCEAIIRSTVDILKGIGVEEVEAMTFALEQDMQCELDKEVCLTPYKNKPLIIKVLGKLIRDITGNGVWSQRYIHKYLDYSNETTCIFNVGGDTYCYGQPFISYALNDAAKKSGKKTVFWGCSVDERVLYDKKMQEDINKYSYIFARESLSYNIIKTILKDKDKICQVCDPAFHLEKKETELPEGFVKGNCVGINLSPLVFSDAENLDDMMYKNIRSIVSYILDNTEMGVCFIPHVYGVDNCSQDIKVLSKLYKEYEEIDRVSVVSNSLSCREIKYIISNCRFFIGSRTHATIAAYSSKVPCIAISYSIKSRGIAKDLFGNEDGYVVKWQDIKNENDILTMLKAMINNESEVKKIYDTILPEYTNTIVCNVEKMWSEINA